MEYIYKNTDKIAFRNLKKMADAFFKDTEPLLFGVNARSELEFRLRWLSEGSLGYHLRTKPQPPHGGDVGEMELYKKWFDFLEFYGY